MIIINTRNHCKILLPVYYTKYNVILAPTPYFTDNNIEIVMANRKCFLKQ